jgi:hypothetical protein
MSDAALPDTAPALVAAPAVLAPTAPALNRRALGRAAVLGCGAGIGLAAVVARVYELRDVPRLTDETDEVMRGLAIARGELLPLTNVDAYIGPLWSYLLALGFLVAGPSSLLPRLLTVATALLTILAAGWLGRELALRLGMDRHAASIGLGATLLLATSSFHAVVSSRLAWSHALTPLTMTVALALLVRWERLRGSRDLLAAGLAYGLAVHTHPTALAFGPGLGIWALLQGRAVLASRAGWGAAGLFVLANAPMLAYNLLTGFGSASAAAQVQRAYAAGSASSSGGYVGNLGALLASLPLLVAGEIGERRGAMLALDDPLPFVYAALVGVGIALALTRRHPLPTLLFVSAGLVLPLVNGKYEPLFNGRYLAPLLPLVFALVPAGMVAVPGSVTALRALTAPLVALALVGLTVSPVLALAGYVAATLRDGPNNAELYRAVEIARAAGSEKPILVDATISGMRLSTGREGTGVLEYLLILDAGVPVRRYQPADLAEAVERGEGDLVVVSPRLHARLDKDFILEAPPGEDEARGRRRAGFAVLRIVGRS